MGITVLICSFSGLGSYNGQMHLKLNVLPVNQTGSSKHNCNNTLGLPGQLPSQSEPLNPFNPAYHVGMCGMI